MRLAVIGAGMAGVTCARRLADAGLSPVIFEKSRGLGGRLATRRADDWRFDHGAQFVTARKESFRTYLETHAARWNPVGASKDWFVGTPAMNALVKPMADGLDIRLGEAVTAERDGQGWRIGDAVFDRVVSTVPVVQARTLFPEMQDTLSAVEVAPCWTLMVVFKDGVDWPEMARSREGDLAWIARNASKPQRDAAKECWVVHASPAWSTVNLELDKGAARDQMLDLLRTSRGDLPAIAYSVAHRWRYAMTTTPLGYSHAMSEDESLLIGGDWCLGARVEDAWDSGQAMAAAIVGGK